MVDNAFYFLNDFLINFDFDIEKVLKTVIAVILALKLIFFGDD